MDFLDALTYNDTYTENLMPAHSTSGNRVLDMFFKMGGSRNLSVSVIKDMLANAIAEDRELAVKSVFYNRDIRGGQGERRTFRIFFHYLATNYPEIARANIENVPHYGRWDDLLVALDTPIEDDVVDFILHALKSGDQLCAKWMPRENKALGDIAKRLMRSWDLSPKQYRKLLAGNTDVVENLMCRNDWDEIVYEHVPSKAMSKYRDAFMRHDPERFDEFLDDVESGEKEIHADSIFPHDVIAPYLTGRKNVVDRTIEEQWKALPDYMPKGYRIMPVCDVSGSMTRFDGLPMKVSVALGIYLAERNEGPYHNAFITFSGNPHLQRITGQNLYEKVRTVSNADWAMNTNLEAVFRLILEKAHRHSVPADQLPETVLIISDMQFDECVRLPTDNAFEMITRMYKEAGYELPNVVFWNLRTGSGVPVKMHESGTALVSGFSPSILRNMFQGELQPMRVMMNTLNDERYDRVKI